MLCDPCSCRTGASSEMTRLEPRLPRNIAYAFERTGTGCEFHLTQSCPSLESDRGDATLSRDPTDRNPQSASARLDTESANIPCHNR